MVSISINDLDGSEIGSDRNARLHPKPRHSPPHAPSPASRVSGRPRPHLPSTRMALPRSTWRSPRSPAPSACPSAPPAPCQASPRFAPSLSGSPILSRRLGVERFDGGGDAAPDDEKAGWVDDGDGRRVPRRHHTRRRGGGNTRGGEEAAQAASGNWWRIPSRVTTPFPPTCATDPTRPNPQALKPH
jgi:hypothetical protein